VRRRSGEEQRGQSSLLPPVPFFRAKEWRGTGRASSGKVVCHFLNRGNGPANILPKNAYFFAFFRVMREAQEWIQYGWSAIAS